MLLLILSTFYMETFLLCNLGITIYPIENLFIIFSVILIYINALNIQDQCWQLFTPNNANNGITSQYFQLSFIVLFILFSEFFHLLLAKTDGTYHIFNNFIWKIHLYQAIIKNFFLFYFVYSYFFTFRSLWNIIFGILILIPVLFFLKFFQIIVNLSTWNIFRII